MKKRAVLLWGGVVLLSILFCLVACKHDIEPEVYNVTFVGNGADSGKSPAVKKVFEGETITLPSEDSLSKEDYYFICWNTAEDGTGTDYMVGDEITVSSDIILYAKWDKNVLKFRFIEYSNTYAVSCQVKTITNIDIPSEYKGKLVTRIDDGAFYNCNELTSVTIPKNISYIGDNAFLNCKNLETVVIEEGVADIGKHAFEWCTALKGIIIPQSVKRIGDLAFSGCTALASIHLGDRLESIGYEAFLCCSALESITIPSTVESIAKEAFLGCTGIKSVVLNEYTCNSLTIQQLFSHSYTSIESVEIHEGVTVIGERLFSGCSNLASVTIPKTVGTIKARAFNECSNLSTIEYNSTKEDWNKISKGDGWDTDTGNYTIACTDGNIESNPASTV